VRIQVFFSALLLLSIVFGGLLAWFFYHLSRKRAQPG
jgi:hypothetical protein